MQAILKDLSDPRTLKELRGLIGKISGNEAQDAHHLMMSRKEHEVEIHEAIRVASILVEGGYLVAKPWHYERNLDEYTPLNGESAYIAEGDFSEEGKVGFIHLWQDVASPFKYKNKVSVYTPNFNDDTGISRTIRFLRFLDSRKLGYDNSFNVQELLSNAAEIRQNIVSMGQKAERLESLATMLKAVL